ncbi:ankyrin repeat domain-containing protein [Streptomyces sp. NPDC057543]|uniref:ankyrin repeat domain-containing protein n=1 Tax=Streptomyces sp. NPDC057543 TaxID=3346163 RepID=UPI0036C67A3C
MSNYEVRLDRGGRSPLHYAALEGDLQEITHLLEQGVDPNIPDKKGFTALHFAAQQWQVQAAEMLLNGGAEVDPRNKYGNTPLMVATHSSQGRDDLIELLRSRGADPFAETSDGRTPFGLARLVGYNFFADLEEREDRNHNG